MTAASRSGALVIVWMTFSSHGLLVFAAPFGTPAEVLHIADPMLPWACIDIRKIEALGLSPAGAARSQP